MRKLFLFLTLAILSTQVSFAQVQWNVDPAHSNVRFSVKHLGIAFVDGEFTTLEGSAEATTDQKFDNAKINFSIDVNSINTRIEARDTHLKSDDFFSAATFPTITLANAILKQSGKSKFVLEGDLTIKDVTKTVKFDVVQNNGIITDPWGMTRAGFTGKISIDRTDYNINYDDKLPTGVDAVAKNIDIVINVEVVKQ